MEFISKKDHLWAKVLIHNYIRGEVAFSKLVRKLNSHNLWRGLTLVATLLLQGSRAKVHDGHNTFFLRDAYV